MKDKCNVIIQKQIIIKIITWWHKSCKTLMQIWKDSYRMILGCPSVSQTHRIISDFKACLRLHPFMKLQVVFYTILTYLYHFLVGNILFILDPFLDPCPLFPINLGRVWINESLSVALSNSMWTAWFVKPVNKAQYHLC